MSPQPSTIYSQEQSKRNNTNHGTTQHKGQFHHTLQNLTTLEMHRNSNNSTQTQATTNQTNHHNNNTNQSSSLFERQKPLQQGTCQESKKFVINSRKYSLKYENIYILNSIMGRLNTTEMVLCSFPRMRSKKLCKKSPR